MKSIIKVGDKVSVSMSDLSLWTPEMHKCNGKVGIVIEIDNNFGYKINFDDYLPLYWWNSLEVTLVECCNVRVSLGTEYYKDFSIPLDVYEKLLNKELQITIQAI